MPDNVTENVLAARDVAVIKAWDSLSRYKFEMFGYWASGFVKYNSLLPKELKVANPFRDAVHLARSKESERLERRCSKCGEYWPCSDSKRTDINPNLRALHGVG